MKENELIKPATKTVWHKRRLAELNLAVSDHILKGVYTQEMHEWLDEMGELLIEIENTGE